jgi:hypothetical protein
MDPITVAKLWILVKPVKRIRLANKRRKARKVGLPEPQSLDDQGENDVFPKGTMTKSGAVIAMAGPVIGIALAAFGVGSECPAELPDCQTSGEIANGISASVGGLITAIGGIIAWRGRNRVGK